LKINVDELHIDELTKLYTFKSFLKLTEQLLVHNPKVKYMITVWHIVRFKFINELFGMETGDKILYEIARIFHNDADHDNLSGRIGNDIFICCCRKESYSLEDIKAKMNYHVNDKDQSYKIIMQAGVYFIEEQKLPVINMCDSALIALNSIRGNYYDQAAIYEEKKHNALATEIEIVSDLEDGIKKHQFYIMIQPVFRITDNVVTSGEVLVRWNHPRKGIIFPEKFIPLLENSNLITLLDQYVWEEACILIKEMQDRGMVPIPLSVNISRINLNYEDLGEKLDRLIERYKIPHDQLRLELTESAYMDNPKKFLRIIRDLKQRGFLVIMDDLGTGYSSLKLIKDFPFYAIKIDKSLIDEVESSRRACNIVCSVIKMSKLLNMKVIAEGIENHKQVECLKNMGCNYIQGFFYAKPLEIDSFFNKEYRN